MAKQTKDRKPKTFVLLDGSVTTYGFRVLVDGVDTTQFERNPVMFYEHADYKLPIGTWSNIRKEKGQLLADANFDYDDPDIETQRIIGKVERDIIKMCSVGLREPVWSDDEIYKIDGQSLPTTVTSRLREASIAAIGGNHNALRMYDKEDAEIDLSNEIKLSDFINPYKKSKMNEELLKLLNLSDKADEKAVVTAIVALKDSNANLTKEKETLTKEKEGLQGELDKLKLADKEGKKAKFVSDVEQAAKDGRINANGKDHLISLYDSNPDGATAYLNSIPTRQSVYGQIVQSKAEETTELSDLLSKSWDELDKSGKLITLKDKYPDAYIDKYKAKFGTEPTV